MSSLDYALSKARAIPFVKGQYRHYALVLSKRGKILAECSNSYTKTSPRMLKAAIKAGLPNKPYWHAECRALHSVKDVDKINKLIVVRVGKEGEPLNSKPCSICEGLIKDMGVKVIEYSI